MNLLPSVRTSEENDRHRLPLVTPSPDSSQGGFGRGEAGAGPGADQESRAGGIVAEPDAARDRVESEAHDRVPARPRTLGASLGAPRRANQPGEPAGCEYSIPRQKVGNTRGIRRGARTEDPGAIPSPHQDGFPPAHIRSRRALPALSPAWEAGLAAIRVGRDSGVSEATEYFGQRRCCRGVAFHSPAPWADAGQGEGVVSIGVTMTVSISVVSRGCLEASRYPQYL